MKAEINVRQEQILESALRRFSHFGIGKTTLTEVAEDLSLTKQALAHYYPDKQSLTSAVVEKITDEYVARLQLELSGATTVKAALKAMVEVKHYFFKKHFMLIIQADAAELSTNRMMQSWKTTLADRELDIISTVLDNAVRSGEIRKLDSRHTAGLLLDTLLAFSRCVKERCSVPDADAFEELFQKQHQVLDLFYDGLKSPTWKS